MKATAIVPLKRFSAAKQRLSRGLPPRFRASLAEAMVGDVLAALSEVPSIERTLLVSGEPRARAVAAAAGVELLDDPDDAGHSAAARIGVRAALAAGAECVALLPGDCPLLDPTELEALLSAARRPGVGVLADRHGSGTNGLILSPPDAIEPAFGPGSRERHLRRAAEAGVAGAVLPAPSLELDLDTHSDLVALDLALADGGQARAPRTAAALAVLDAAEIAIA